MNKKDYFANNIEVAMEPPTSTHQSALRVIKPKGRPAFVGKYDKSEVVQWRKEFVQRVRDITHLPHIPKKKAVHLSIILCYTAPASRPIKDGKLRPKLTKPDLDNVSKSIIDGLVEVGCIETDEQVFSLKLTKVEWDKPFIHISYSEVTEDNWANPL
jgi:Holliday junction resolvase RusA-like endonuclease